MLPISASELMKYIGKEGRFKANGFVFEVKIIDARCDRSGMEFLVMPIAGEGRCWISSCLIALEEGKKQ